ncbi:putative membrane protein [Acinetobacter sp. 263903-1]|nr:putative membrane protein [Acinetobacter sp. 1461402]EXB68863.1 putative membrane protein [Acinetobacter sp. 230853]EXC24742.1 putative membrane protein [Acinetobacter sp. 869535]EXE13397.1 putative membrane protein [Acinetobacter sp. 983759]KCX36156.1 putative membrane protein [Acinetobacter sp. 263903-1]
MNKLSWILILAILAVLIVVFYLYKAMEEDPDYLFKLFG